MKTSIWKWLILVLVLGWSFSLAWPPAEKIKLGLDLQGGTSYTLEVIKDGLEGGNVRDARDRGIEVIRNRIDSMGVAEPSIYPDGEERIVVQIPGMKAEDRQRASENIRKAAFLEFRMVHPRSEELVNNLFMENKVPAGYTAVSLPGRPGAAGGNFWARKGNPPTEEEREALKRFEEKTGYDLLLERVTVDGKDYFRPAYVSRKTDLTGANLQSAEVGYGQMAQRSVQFSLDAQGRKIFGKLTSDYAPGGAKNPDPNAYRQLAIVLDGTLYSAPRINQPITGGSGEITGSFTLEEASDLALVLRAGALPAPLRVIEERTVDPTLGTDSVNSGKQAALIGLAAVLIFTILYYRFAGFVASIALLLNIILLPLGMVIVSGFFGLFGGAGMGQSLATLPVLTMPGIAGIVLSVGMAVDANVLIFERIREEMRTGKRFGAALDAGYHKAFGTILDANITTLLAAIIMFWQGSGPVKGFAITLSAGIIASIYTAVFVTRMVFDFLENRGWLNKLSMTSLVPQTKVNFVGMYKFTGTLSILALVATLGYFAHRGADNFGVDFTGGVQLSLAFEQRVDVDDLRSTLETTGLRDLSLIQYQRGAGENEGEREVLAIKAADQEESERAVQALNAAFPESRFTLRAETVVGPQIGDELKKSGMLAILFALIGMVIYITIRFEFSFAVGATVGLIHNILLTLGIYALFGRQLTMTSIAAFLTVLGYSVNDTIVVFDRIREVRKLRGGKLNTEVANASLNQTLARTLLTSVTTLISIVALMVFGGGEIYDFALIMLIGIVVGTYASVFIATPIMLACRPKEGSAAAKQSK